MNFSTPSSSVPHYLLEFAQIHVHWVDDTIYPPQHQGLFQWLSSSHQVAKVLELQHQSFQYIFKADFLWDWLVWFPCHPRDSQEPSPAPQFESINSLWLWSILSIISLLCDPILTSVHNYWKNHTVDYTDLDAMSKIRILQGQGEIFLSGAEFLDLNGINKGSSASHHPLRWQEGVRSGN